MKRLIIGSTFFFVSILLMTKFFENRNWERSLFAALFQTVVFFFVGRYFLKWWNKKSAEQRREVIKDKSL